MHFFIIGLVFPITINYAQLTYYTHLKNYIIIWLIINLNSNNQTKMFIKIFWIIYFNYFKTSSWFNHEINYLANKTWVFYRIINLFPIHTFPSLSLLCPFSNGSVHLPVSVKYNIVKIQVFHPLSKRLSSVIVSNKLVKTPFSCPFIGFKFTVPSVNWIMSMKSIK